MGTTLLAEYEDVLGRAELFRKSRLSSSEREELLDIFIATCSWTEAFLQRFEAGELGDAGEWFDWEAIAALKTEAERKLGKLERAGV